MKRQNPPKDLDKAMRAGYQPMFMTGPEIMRNARVNPDDIREGETVVDTWRRKLKEAKMTGEEHYGKEAFEPGRTLRGYELKKKGIGPKTSLESEAKKHGLPGFVSLENYGSHRYLIGGHHRVALSNEQFKSHIFPVKYFESLGQAKQDPGYR
jgi:hypothetical protein